MQDSLGDYIRITNNICDDPKTMKDNKNVADMGKIKDELITLERKKQSDNYARKIVEFLIDGKLQPQIFLKTLNFINQDHYQDIVEERAVTKLCGYPLCGKNLPDMPKKQFHISTKSNKVYDITERKNFCSNYCYHASGFIKKQIDTSPLWVRTTDDLLKFTLLSKDEVTSPGIEIDHGIAKPPVEPVFTSVTSFTEACLDEAGELEKPRNLHESDEELDLNPLVKAKIDISSKYKKVGSKIIKCESVATKSILKTNEVEVNPTAETSQTPKEKKVMFNVEEPNVTLSKDEQITDLNNFIGEFCKTMDISLEEKPSEVKVAKKPHTQQELMKIIKSVEEKKALQPVTSEVPKFSKDDKNLKQIIEKVQNLEINKHQKYGNNDKLKSVLEKLKSKSSNDKKPIFVNTTENPEIQIIPPKAETIVKPINKKTFSLKCVKECLFQWITIETYIFIYGREQIKSVLNEDLLDNYFDKLNVAELNTTQQVKYMNICKKLQLQELSEAKFDGVILNTKKQLKPLPDYSRLKEEGKDMNLKVKAFYASGVFEKDDPNFKIVPKENEGAPSVLPLVDAHSQHAMRRKIFINAIIKHLQKHVKELELSNDVIIDVQEMVKTFKLEANNIIIKPPMWIIVAMILIIMLSVNKNDLKDKLSTTEAVEYKDEILSKCTDGSTVLTEIMELIENVDVYVQKYIVDDK